MIRRGYIAIEKPTTLPDLQGGFSENFVQFWAGWAKVDELTFKESMQFGQPTSNKTIKIHIRKNSLTEQINSTYRLLYRGKFFDILMGSREVDHFTLELLASCRQV